MASSLSLATRWQRAILAENTLKPMSRVIAVAMFSRFADDEGYLFASLTKIEEHANCARSTASAAIEDLAAHGWIEQTEKPTPNSAAVWRIRIPVRALSRVPKRGTRRSTESRYSRVPKIGVTSTEIATPVLSSSERDLTREHPDRAHDAPSGHVARSESRLEKQDQEHEPRVPAPMPDDVREMFARFGRKSGIGHDAAARLIPGTTNTEAETSAAADDDDDDLNERNDGIGSMINGYALAGAKR